MYKLILTDNEAKSDLTFVFNQMADLTQFMSDAFETAEYPLVATVGEVTEEE